MALPEELQALADMGYALVPATAQKRPLVPWRQWTERPQTPDEQADLPRGELYAIITGSLYDLVVLDFDGAEGVSLATSLKLSPNVTTGSGGWHVWLDARAIDFPVKTCAGVRPGLDVRGEGGLVYLYGTSSKGTYRLHGTDKYGLGVCANLNVLGLIPEKQDATGSAPEGTWDGDGDGTPGALRVLNRATTLIRSAAAGTSNSVLTKQAYSIGGLVASGELDGDAAYRSLLAAATERGAGDPERIISYQLEMGAAAPWATVIVDDEGTEWVSASDLPAWLQPGFQGGKDNGDGTVTFEVHSARNGDSGRATPAPASTPAWVDERADVPYDALPQEVSDLVRYGWEVTAAPPEFIAAACLPALSAAIGGLTTLGLRDGWRIPPSVYMALVGAPSTAKSPAIRRALAPVRAAEEAAWQSVQDGSPDTRYIVDDVTTEKLAELLNENPRGLLVYTDELRGFFGGMGQYKSDAGGGRDRQFYLSAWDGGSITVDRIKRGSLHVARPTLTIVGGIQPEVFDSLTDGAVDGMMERFLMVWGDPVADTWRDDDIDPQLVARYSRLWNSVRDNYMADTVVPMTPEARRAWKSWYDSFHAMTPPERLGSLWNKVRTHVARIALILACCDDGRCEATHIERAIVITEWLLSNLLHVLRCSAATSADERRHVKARERLDAFLRDWYDQNGRLPSPREVLQFGPPGSRRARERDTLLAELGIAL